MYRDLVLKRNYAKDSTFKFFNLTPEAETVLLLWLTPQRILDNPDTPLLLQVGALPQYLVLEIRCERVIHDGNTNASGGARECVSSSLALRALREGQNAKLL